MLMGLIVRRENWELRLLLRASLVLSERRSHVSQAGLQLAV